MNAAVVTERGNAPSARVRAVLGIPAMATWIHIRRPALRVRGRVSAGIAGVPVSGDGSRATKMFRGGSLRIEAAATRRNHEPSAFLPD